MSEKIYDEQIAPKLLEVANLCNEHGLAMVATVEYEKGERGTTRMNVGPKASAAMYLLSVAAATGNNFDGLVLRMIKWSRENNVDTSGSIYLSGVLGK